MGSGDDWSKEEVEAAVAFYAEMLRLEFMGQPFNKAERNRAVQNLTGRSKGSVEFKHQNISAVLNEAGFPYIAGYKPRSNIQGILADVVIQRIIEDETLNELARSAALREEFSAKEPSDLLSIRVERPSGDGPVLGSAKRIQDTPAFRPRRDYLALEARNSELGLAGEKLVLAYEHRRLWTAGKKHLAERIEHVSKSKGDYLGYDILSFDESGKERLIEVKTTQFGPMTPFFASANEVAVSIEQSDHYQLYRLFTFTRDPKLFTLEGAIGKNCDLKPSVFAATPKCP